MKVLDLEKMVEWLCYVRLQFECFCFNISDP